MRPETLQLVWEKAGNILEANGIGKDFSPVQFQMVKMANCIMYFVPQLKIIKASIICHLYIDLLVFVVLEIKLRTSHMLDKHSQLSSTPSP
jgi:hypothetical protein